MSGMTLIERPFEKGSPFNEVYLNGISFSVYSTPRVPTAKVYDNSAFLDTQSFHSSPANVLEFIYRTCAWKQPFGDKTRWGDSIFAIDASGFKIAVPKIDGNEADQMSFQVQTLYSDEADESEFLLRTMMEYRSPTFYLLQFAELPLARSDWELTIKDGVAATLIAGGAALFSPIAERHNILRHGEITMEDATTIANGIAHKEMSLNPGNFVYESALRRYGYSCDGSTMDHAPDLAVKFSSNGTNIYTMLGQDLELKGPSIAVLQNMPISAYGFHDSVVSIVRDLVFAASQMCPTLPLASAL